MAKNSQDVKIKKLIEISKIINYDPRAISKEVKRNRKPVDYTDQTESKCPKLNRWPYVCTNCKNRYKDCPFVKFIYDSKVAQSKANANLVNSRKGIDLTSDEDRLLAETEETRMEILNIQNKPISGSVYVKFFSTSKRKDRWSAMCMALYGMDILTDERLKKKDELVCMYGVSSRR